MGVVGEIGERDELDRTVLPDGGTGQQHPEIGVTPAAGPEHGCADGDVAEQLLVELRHRHAPS